MEKEDVFLKETEVFHSLRTLEEIEKNPNISQRELSKRLGVALGITNALLKTLARKGLIKIRGESNRTLT
jgi:DNA-binding MarR family transcriptional regulator